MNNPLMKVSAAIVASAGNLVSNTARWTDDLYWDGKQNLEKYVVIHEDHFNHLASLLNEYQTMKAEDEQRQREQDQADYDDTIASFQGDIESSIRRGCGR